MKRLAVLVALLVTAAGLPGLTATPAVAATPTAGQSLYVPLDPTRVLDTRYGVGAPRGLVGPGGVLDLRAPAGATSVVLNVTATGASTSTEVRVYPTPTGAEPVPTVSSLNVPAGVTIANLVTATVGSGGTVRLRNNAGRVHLVADLAGSWTARPSGASSYVPRAPVRLLDTRTTGSPVGAGQVRRLDVRRLPGGGASGVPDGATAVAFNLTAVAPTAATDVRAYPFRQGSAAFPGVSNLNATRGRVVPNLVVVKVGDLGSVALRNTAGSTHLVADLAGWFVAGDGGAALHPVVPLRVLDTRGTGARLQAGGTVDLQLGGGRVDVPDASGGRESTASPVPFAATAVVLNVTAVGASATSDVRVYPTPSQPDPPTVSTLNLVAGQTVPNAVIVPLGPDGTVRLRNTNGSVDLLVDLAGWLAPTGDGWDVSWPQCTDDLGVDSRTGTSSRHPATGAFAVVGIDDGRPFRASTCADDQRAWAAGLSGPSAVYVIVNAPGAGAEGGRWTAPGPFPCNGTSGDPGCGSNYGDDLAADVVRRLPPAADGTRPMVWLDVEDGVTWQSAAVNGNVVIAAANRLRADGFRVGIYSDATDWRNIMGELQLRRLPLWTSYDPAKTAEQLCAEGVRFAGGPVVMAQGQLPVDGRTYDTDHLC